MKHPFRIVVSFLVISLLGVAVIPRLSVNLNPDYSEPAFTVSFSLPGSSPETVEQEATSLLENAFAGLTNLNEIRSVSSYDKGTITLVFDKETDMAFKRFEVVSILRNIRPSLPARMSYPEITQTSEEKDISPLLVYRVNAPFATTYIKQQIERHLLRRVAGLPGVEKVETAGAVPLQIVVETQPALLRKTGFTHSQLLSRIREGFAVQQMGYVHTGHGWQLYVRAGEPARSLHDIRELIVDYAGLYPVRVKDLARVYIDEQERQSYFRVNGLNSVSLRIYARQGQNRIELARQVKQVVADRQGLLPPGFQVQVNYDDTLFLRKELHKIYFRSGLSILILTLFIFLSYRNWRHLVILMSGIAVNLCLTVLVSWLLHINIHLYTIAGITIAFGLIVDNAIVMLDHLRRHRTRGIFLALLAATATTVAALAVVYFLPEEERQNLSEFAAIIMLALFNSLVVALWFTPAMVALLMPAGYTSGPARPPRRWAVRWFRRYYRLLTFLARHRKKMLVALVLIFGTPIFMLPASWEGHEWYNVTVGSDLYQEDIRPVSDKWLGGTLRWFVRNVFEKSGYRSNEQTRLYVQASLPYGHTVEQMNKAIRHVEDYLQGISGIDKFVTTVYSGRFARVVITFKEDYERGALPYFLKSRLIAQSLNWAGVEWSVYGVGRGFSNATGESLPGFRVVMKGYNYDELARQADILAAKLLRHKRIQKVNTNERVSWEEEASTQLVLQLDPARFARQASLYEVTEALRGSSWQQQPQGSINLAGTLLPVVVRDRQAADFSAHDLTGGALWLNDSTGLANATFVDLQKTTTINAIHKENRQYIRVVGFDYYGSARFGGKYLDKVLKEMAAELPMGYEAKRSGWYWDWNKTKRNYGLLLLLTVAIYFICSIMFENLRQPLYIIGMVPMSFVGLFITFAGFDLYFDQGGYAAFVLLGGLTVNAAIFIVYDLHHLPGRHYNRKVAKAVWGKARPVLLTVASSCFGLLPFLLEGQNEVFWFSLAAGTIGGLTISLVAVFLVLPVWLMKRKEHFNK